MTVSLLSCASMPTWLNRILSLAPHHHLQLLPLLPLLRLLRMTRLQQLIVCIQHRHPRLRSINTTQTKPKAHSMHVRHQRKLLLLHLAIYQSTTHPIPTHPILTPQIPSQQLHKVKWRNQYQFFFVPA